MGAKVVVPPGADHGIRSVRFQTRSPTGQRSAFVDGMTIVDPTNTNEGTTPIGSYYYSSGPVAVNSAVRGRGTGESRSKIRLGIVSRVPGLPCIRVMPAITKPVCIP